MKESVFKSKYRYVIGALIVLNTVVMIFSSSIAIPMFTIISADTGIDIGMTGLISSVVALTVGIMMLLGSVVIEKTGCKLSITLSLILSVAGNLMVFFFTDFFVVLIGRAIVGVGIGLNSIACISFITMWFPVKEKPLIFSLITIGCTGTIFLAYALALPLVGWLGGFWRNVFCVMAAASAVFLILWILFGKINADYAPETAVDTKRGAAILIALKRGDIWLIALYVGMLTFAISAINTYLPIYLETIRGYDVQTASTYAGFVSLAQIVGGMLAGIVTSALGMRKPVFLTGSILGLASILVMYNTSGKYGLIAMLVAYGFFSTIYSPVMQTVATELKDVTSELASAAYSMMFGLGSLLSFFAPMILSALLRDMCLDQALYFFVGVAVIGIIIGFFVGETGPKAWAKPGSTQASRT